MARRQRTREPESASTAASSDSLSQTLTTVPAFVPEEVLDAFRRFRVRTETLAPLVPLALLGLMLSVSWGRWAQELVDHGREMNLPTRILAGERLYLDVQYLYGPFAPYFNAFLYKVFGIHLATLAGAGIVCAALILLGIYWIARRLLDPVEAVLVSAFVLAVCGFRPAGNYIQPYAYAALYALVFALAALAAALRYVESEEPRALAWSGVAAGMALVAKPEFAVAALGVALLALLLVAASRRRIPWRAGLAFGCCSALVGGVVYGAVLRRVPLGVLLEDNHLLFTNLPPQVHYFVRSMSGFLDWPMTLWRSLASLGFVAALAGFTGCVGALASGLAAREARVLLRRSALLLLGGAGWWQGLRHHFQIPGRPGAFVSTPLVLAAAGAFLLFRLAREVRGARSISIAERTRALCVLFAALTIGRMVFLVTPTGAYSPFLLPGTLMVFAYGFLRSVPALLAPSARTRERVRIAALAILTTATAATLARSAVQFRERATYEVVAPRGSFWISPAQGEPVADAVRFVRERTAPGDYVLTLPQATSINFLAERRTPLKEEVTPPGTLGGSKETEAMERIAALRVPLILVANVLTPEFGQRAFGIDYNQDLMRWIAERYRPVARFDAQGSEGAAFGDPAFFIVAYERLSTPGSR